MQGSSYVEIPMSNDYVALEAYSVDPQASNGSGDEGSYFQGMRIYWETDENGGGGITGISWYTENVNSPFFGVAVNDILTYIEANGNLNDYFANWMSSGADKQSFILDNIARDCWGFV